MRQNNSWLPWKRPGKVGQSRCCCCCHHPGLPADSGLLPGGREICIDVWGCPELSPVWEGPAFWKLLLPGACKGEDGTDPRTLLRSCVSGGVSGRAPGPPRGDTGLSFWGETRVRAKLGQQAVPLVGGAGDMGNSGFQLPIPSGCRSHICGEGGLRAPARPCAVAPAHDCAAGSAMRPGSPAWGSAALPLT